MKFLLLIVILPFFIEYDFQPTTSQTKYDTGFVKLSDNKDFAFDMRYATTNNFLKEKVYPCATCLIRSEVAEALIKANKIFLQKGFRIKFFDCYRPLDVQKKMWVIKPDNRYVANPKGGSIHNRGAAVDMTLVDLTGKEVDMGTEFDHFGEEAHHSYLKLSPNVIESRKYLKSVMEQCGFVAQPTEWWHYNYGDRGRYKISNESICK